VNQDALAAAIRAYEKDLPRTKRKQSGIYYTPEDVSDCVVRNAIAGYIWSSLGHQFPGNANPPPLAPFLAQASDQDLNLVWTAVEQIHVLDPACGAGALLCKACEILLEIKTLVMQAMKGEPPSDGWREQISSNNIFGIDSLPSAIEVCRLRLRQWAREDLAIESDVLSLISIENNVVVANTLLKFPKSKTFLKILDAGGFDVVVANPPYGDILTDEEKEAIAGWETGGIREIAANFIERILQIMHVGGHMGLIIANAIAINQRTAPVRDLIRKHLSECRMALFGTRPGRLFADAEIRAMLLWGERNDPATRGETGVIYTTDARKFFQRDRSTALESLSFESTAGLELGAHAIGDGIADTALPKVGFPTIRQILLKLRDQSAILVGDRINKPGYQEILTLRATGGYWLTALEQFPYSSTKLHSIFLETPLERDFLLLLVNSSLFYLFWSTYSNLRDFKINDMLKFPFPVFDTLAHQAELIYELAQRLSSSLLQTFENLRGRRGGRRGEFHPGQCLDMVHQVDDFVCAVYGLTEADAGFIKNYDNHLRKPK